MTHAQQAHEAAVIGLGIMGAALARALLTRGHRITVWNRSAQKAQPLAAAGARVAATAADAVAASPLIIMCVSDYAATEAVLRSAGVAQAMASRTLVQLTTCTRAQIREQADRMRPLGARFLAGGIMTFPSAISQPSSMIVYGGDPRSFAEHRSVLASLGGSLQYVGEDPGAAVGAYFALASFVLASVGGYLESVAIARSFGLSAEQYYGLARVAQDEIARSIRDFTFRVMTGQLEAREASLALMETSVADICREIDHAGIPAKLTPAFLELVRLAIGCGHGAHDMPALVEALVRATDKKTR